MPVFAVPPELEDLRSSVRRFLRDRSPETEVRRLMDTEAGYDPGTWKQLATQLGLTGLIVPEEFGGAGAGRTELGVVFEETGRALLCAPFFSTVALATHLLLASGDRRAQGRYLPGIAGGDTVATVAIAAADPARRPPGGNVTAVAGGAGWELTGVEPFVVDGHVADLLLVPARTRSGISLFAVRHDAAGLSRSLLTTVDRTRKQARVGFAATPAELVGTDGAAAPAIEEMLDRSAIALASEQAGGAAAALEAAVDHARTRIQFGRPIGGFQAVKHMLADLLLESESATSAARYVAGAADAGRAEVPALVSLARAYCSDAYVRIAADAVQLHGGIGFTWDHPAHLYLRRARTSAQLLGDPAHHREQYLRRAGDRPEPDGTDTAPTDPADAPEPAGTAALRREVRQWLRAEWDPARPRREFVTAAVDAGWAAPRWPAEWFGRGLSDELGHVVEAEFRRVGAPGSGQDRHNLYAATVLSFGADELRRGLVGPILRGDVAVCLLYSEPGAGSDLAAVRTRADRDGDGWIVDGQKVWTSGAGTADYGLLVARTDWDVPKHQGITFFVLDMRQDGVEVRPIHQITGESHFNEVFLSGARVPDTHRLGEPGQGWDVLQTALAYERSVMGDRARSGRADRAPGDVGDVLVALARETGRLDDPVVRQDLARVAALRRINAWNNQRAKAELVRGSSSSVMSLGKLAMSRLLHESARVRTALAGARSMFEGAAEPVGDEANFLALNAYFTSIGGGTDQIQRNIIAERILGLPKEIEVDRTLPFREVRHG